MGWPCHNAAHRTATAVAVLCYVWFSVLRIGSTCVGRIRGVTESLRVHQHVQGPDLEDQLAPFATHQGLVMPRNGAHRAAMTWRSSKSWA